MNLIEWLDYSVLGNSVLVWGTAVVALVVAWLVLAVVRRVVQGRLGALAKRRDRVSLRIATHVAKRTKGWFVFLVAVYVGSRFLALPDRANTILNHGIVVLLLLQAGLWASTALSSVLALRRERKLTEDPDAVAAMDLVGFVVHVAIWSIVLLVTLDTFGINITALVAGLGVGGIAVALAAQNILGDLFASLSIVLDKPFVVGDFLIIGDSLGTVEKVGLKTTRLRSLSGEQLVFSNNDLLSSRIRNYGRMYERRIVFSIGVTYQTSLGKLREIPTILREAVESQDRVRFDRAHFQKYGDFALIFEVVYYVLSPEYNVYMDIQQAVNLLIYERFGDEGIEFAYPTQTLFLVRQGGGEPGERGANSEGEPS